MTPQDYALLKRLIGVRIHLLMLAALFGWMAYQQRAHGGGFWAFHAVTSLVSLIAFLIPVKHPVVKALEAGTIERYELKAVLGAQEILLLVRGRRFALRVRVANEVDRTAFLALLKKQCPQAVQSDHSSPTALIS